MIVYDIKIHAGSHDKVTDNNAKTVPYIQR